MRRNRVLTIFIIFVAMSSASAWLGTVLAAAEIVFNEGLTVDEGNSSTILSDTLLTEDSETSGAITYTLVTTPMHGLLALNGTNLAPTDSLLQADIDAELLVYTHDGSETLSDSFEFTVTSGIEVLTDTFLITINPIYDHVPVITDQTFAIAENSAIDTAVGIITATDADAADELSFTIIDGNVGNPFSLSTTGAISVADPVPLDFEINPQITFTVQVEDLGALTSTATITVNVTNVNEPPIITPETFTILENSTNGTTVDTVTATDPEEQPLTYEILSGNTNGAFAINSTTGLITVANSIALNYEATPSFTLSIRVTDNGQLGDGTPDPPALSHTADITINLLDVNESPSISNATFSIGEDSPDGTVVGTVTGTDPDAGDTLTYSITGGNTPNTPFAINASNGRITVNNSSALDVNVKAVYSLTISVQDSGGRIATATITINITPRETVTIFLPLLLNNYPPVEPNNHPCESYPIGGSTTYQFTADDIEDWYIFTLPSAGNLTVTLSNFTPAKGQLVVYSGTCNNLNLLQNNGSSGTTKIISLTNRPAGTYFIRVFSDPITNTTYSLRVNIN